ncbi:DUF4132 domain-containing protein [Pimelobacter simplex]|uniref:DUF4132 domain-containing protein n=1 Tax=Nocardioides simplex TaxID=2045 RepID=A0A7J5DV37_NOCSI|nr:DUF4132 domain-containing protein [Pimelobacter simplex]KAB2808936.1 DUF4132 domain-containing protein [Pimelobacter simplex]
MRWFGSERKRARDLPPGVGAEWADALDATFAQLSHEAPGAARDLLSYVLTGIPERALGDVHQELDRLRRTAYRDVHAEQQPLIALSRGLSDVPLPVAVRTAAAVDAIGDGHWHARVIDDVPWLDGLLRDVAIAVQREERESGRSDEPFPLGADLVEDMLAATGHDRELAMVAAFSEEQHRFYPMASSRTALRRLVGYDAAVRRHADAVRPRLAGSVDARLTALEALEGVADETLGLFAEELAQCATATATTVESAARPHVERAGRALFPPLRAIAVEGAPGARAKALDLLHALGDDATASWAEETAGADRAASVRRLAERWQTAPPTNIVPDEDPAPPPPVTVDWRTPVTPELRTRVRAVVASANDRIANEREHWRQMQATRSYPVGPVPEPLAPDFLDAVLDDLAAGRSPAGTIRSLRRVGRRSELGHVLRHAELGVGFPADLALLAAAGDLVEDHRPLLTYEAIRAVEEPPVTERPEPLVVAAVVEELCGSGALSVFHAWGRGWSEQYGLELPGEAWAAFVLAHLDLVIDQLESSERDYWLDEDLAHRAVGVLPRLPAPLVEVLVGQALGSRKRVQRPAQDALAVVPGIEERVIAALGDGKSEVRALAASWLARLQAPAALGALEAAVAKERNDLVIGALLDALEALGQPVEKYLDRGDLLAKADKLAAKPVPAALTWFPWAGLPEVRWADSGAPVERSIVQWLLTQAVKAKSAEPNAVQRRYCAMLDPADRAALGQYVLEAWVAEDLRPIPLEEARRRAAEEAYWVVTYHGHPLHGVPVEQAAETLLPRHLRAPEGSATAAKGLLAIAAVCAGSGAAPVTERYLQEWYGHRPHQGRALIQMLAWIDDPSATQLVLAVGSRFRTKSFQEEATRQAAALAERRGWTMSELADRTVPSAGFDDRGVLELSYGDRVFTARLLPDLAVELRSPEDKVVKSLPAPRQSDDADRVKESKKALAATKKEVKTVAAAQTERLYEALCTGRTWDTEVWTDHLLRHPLLRHLVRRLVWLATAPDGSRTVFRPLDDGTLTDVDDEPVELGPDDMIALAHDALLPEDAVAAWLEHLADYEIVPLFTQLGKERFELPDEQRTATAIEDHLGHLVESFKLRGRATKLGYARGPAEDGGIFVTYVKRFPALGIVTVIDFTGNTLPEENRVVALERLRFERIGGERRRSDVALGDVPAVLLSEAYGDLRALAAVGAGFDPDWQKKVEW